MITTIPRVFERMLRDAPDREALVTRSDRLSYAELDRMADRAANALRTLGVRPGDRVAASLPNDTDVVAAFHGAMRLGVVWVGVNRVLAGPEKAYIVDDCGASVYLAEDDSVPVGQARLVAVSEWRERIAAAPADPVGVDIDPHAPAGIAYTSGTTGRPKGAVHSQWNLLLPGAVLVESRGYGPDLRKGDCLPLTILNLMVLTTLLVAQAGGTCVVMDRVDPEGIADWIRRERVTVWNGPPAMLHGLASNDAVKAEDLATLRELWTGGADCPEAIRSMVRDKFGIEVLATYGLTEAPTVVAIDPPGGPHVDGASGVPLPHLKVRVADSDGRPVAAGETGDILVSAADDRYRPMLGYWQRPDATEEVLAGGELHTGDVGFLDERGYLHVRDRRSLVIIRGGANVYPAEVERVLHEHPAVAAAAVFGLPDERLGERVVAAVELAAGAAVNEDDLREHCRAQLAKYKVPERVIFVDSFSRNAMGKIVRTDLPRLAGHLPMDDVGA